MLAVLFIGALVCAFGLGWMAHEDRDVKAQRRKLRGPNVIDLTGTRQRERPRPW